MITALDALASWMSLSVIWPTPASSTRTFTSSCASFSTVAWIASALPCTSALIRTATSFCSPAWMRASIWSSVPRAPAVAPAVLSRSWRWRNSVISRARLSFSTTTNGSPADRRAAQAQDLDRRRRTGLGDRLGPCRPASRAPGPTRRRPRRCRPAAACRAAPGWCRPDRGRDRAGFRSPSPPPRGPDWPSGRGFRPAAGSPLSSLSRPVFFSRRDLHVLRFAAHFLDHDLVAEQFLPHPGRDWRPACPSC